MMSKEARELDEFARNIGVDFMNQRLWDDVQNAAIDLAEAANRGGLRKQIDFLETLGFSRSQIQRLMDIEGDKQSVKERIVDEAAEISANAINMDMINEFLLSLGWSPAKIRSLLRKYVSKRGRR